MKQKFQTVSMIVIGLLFSGTAYSATLSESVSLAISKSPKVDLSKASLAKATKKVSEEKSGYFPTIGFQVRGGGLNANDDTTRAATGDDASSYLGEGSVTLTQPIFSGFSTLRRTDAAKDRVASADLDVHAATASAALSAIKAHLNLMRTRQLLDLSSSHLKSIETRKERIHAMVIEGAADESEAFQVDEILMAAKSAHLGYDESYRQAQALYIEATGIEPQGDFSLGTPTWDEKIPASIDEALLNAHKQNPQVLSSDKLLEAVSKESDAERSIIMPRVDAEMSYTKKDQNDDVGGELTNAQATMRLTWDFATGGGQIARIGQSIDQKAEASARRADVRRSVDLSIRQNFTSMQTVDKQFELFLEREKMNEKILENYTAQFEAGKQSNLQLVAAEGRLFEAHAARIDAFYRRLLARFELLESLGTLQAALTPSAIQQNTKLQ